MRKYNLLLLCLFFICGNAQNKCNQYANVIRVNDSDSPEKIIEKAAYVIPTKNQMNALKNEFIAFVHFGPNTFTRMEWGSGKEDPSIFTLKHADTDQWCRAMKSAGMKMVILTAKHHDGFVLWQSRYTKHGIMSTDFESGKGDIMKQLSKSCRKYGLKLGVYLSPADLYQIECPEGLYGNLSKYTMREIPREIPGRPFKNKTKFNFMVDDYNEYFLNQLFELLTEYGPIDEVWFDGAHPKTKGGQKYNYEAWRKLIRTLAPNATIFGREDVRWCGNEAGYTRDKEWNVIHYKENPDSMNVFMDLYGDLGTREVLVSQDKPFYLHYQPAETNTSIREGWFYRDDIYQKVRNADDVFDIYERSVGGNSIFLLNIPPNREGQFSPIDTNVLYQTGKMISDTYGNNLLKGAKGPKKVLDGKNSTYVIVKKGESIVITTPKSITMNRLMIQESVNTHSERVEKFNVYAFIEGKWKEIAHGDNIGYKHILRFADITTNKIKIEVIATRQPAAICNVSAHYFQSRPPMLSHKREIEGKITIEPKRQDFNWRDYKNNATSNLAEGCKIYYTIDGSEPTNKSKEFVSPFVMDKGILKAVAYLNNNKGEIYQERIGLVKKGWTILNVSSEISKEHSAANIFDENPYSYWMSEESSKPQQISIDLGKEEVITGFAYTPQRENKEGMISKGIVEVSIDGNKWEKIDTFYFGNLINDPTKRYHYFSKETNARYIRLSVTETADKVNKASIAEIDIY